jgi:hypothetical protein
MESKPMTAGPHPGDVTPTPAHASVEAAGPDCREVAGAPRAEPADRANLMTLETLLSMAHRGTEHVPLATLIADVQELAAATARATAQLIDSLDRDAIESEALTSGALAGRRHEPLNHPDS